VTVTDGCCVECRDNTTAVPSTSKDADTCYNFDAVSATGATTLTYAEWNTADTHGFTYASVGNMPASAGLAVTGGDANLVAGGAITFTWYQPTQVTAETGYTDSLRRYSKDEKVMTYSATGTATALTWVDGTAAVTLASASTLIASAVALGAIALF